MAVAAVIFWPYKPFPDGKFPTPLHDLRFNSRQIEVEPGVKLFVAERPGMNQSLPPIVFLHGVMDSWRSFEHLWPRLTMEHRIIAIDFRGHGSSSKPHDSSYSIDLMLHDVDTVMKALQVTNIGCLVGHSLGSLVAWRFAGKWPTRVERMVLIGTVPYIEPGFSGAMATFKVISSMLGGLDSTPRWFAELNSASMVASTTDMGDWFYDTCTYQTMMWAPFMLSKSLAAFGDSLDPSVTKPIISSITARTTVITGEADSVFPPPQAEPIMDLLRPECNASMLVLPGQGHAVHWTKAGADVVAARIGELLSDRPVSDSDLVEQLLAHPVIRTSVMSTTAFPLLTLLMAVAGSILSCRTMRLNGRMRDRSQVRETEICAYPTSSLAQTLPH
eukprot:TRINITY_DN6832_c0_g1_i2.p1 TRINITY_DN6832_c0_g1~~TRINITY_DN6832_c0_g1_i2.p1  ORF type:complete len:430 (+),score=36.66 TRINITY_DN6832_c0_g1_i2:129-1292(+)